MSLALINKTNLTAYNSQQATAALPAGWAPGELAVVLYNKSGGVSRNYLPQGYSLTVGRDPGSGLFLAHRILQAGDQSPLINPGDYPDGLISDAQVFTFSGFNRGAPIGQSVYSITPPTVPSLDVTVPGSWYIAVGHEHQFANGTGSMTETGTATTELSDQSFNYSDGEDNIIVICTVTRSVELPVGASGATTFAPSNGLGIQVTGFILQVALPRAGRGLDDGIYVGINDGLN